MVEAFERWLDKHWKGRPQFYDFRANKFALLTIFFYHNELAREPQQGLDQPEEDL